MGRKKINKVVDVNPIRNLLRLNLRRLREDNGLTQNELSKRVGLTHNFVNDIENGKKWASDKTIQKLCEALHTEPFQLFMPLKFDGNALQFVVVKHFRDKMVQELDKIMDYYNEGIESGDNPTEAQ